MNVDELLTELECALKAEESDLDRRVDVYNRIVSLAASYLHIPHPVVCPQLVPVDDVRGNDYNPNKVAPPEMRLLKLSIHKDGFTMPVVVGPRRQGACRVDGFHRAAGSEDGCTDTGKPWRIFTRGQARQEY